MDNYIQVWQAADYKQNQKKKKGERRSRDSHLPLKGGGGFFGKGKIVKYSVNKAKYVDVHVNTYQLPFFFFFFFLAFFLAFFRSLTLCLCMYLSSFSFFSASKIFQVNMYCTYFVYIMLPSMICYSIVICFSIPPFKKRDYMYVCTLTVFADVGSRGNEFFFFF